MRQAALAEHGVLEVDESPLREVGERVVDLNIGQSASADREPGHPSVCETHPLEPALLVGGVGEVALFKSRVGEARLDPSRTAEAATGKHGVSPVDQPVGLAAELVSPERDVLDL